MRLSFPAMAATIVLGLMFTMLILLGRLGELEQQLEQTPCKIITERTQ